MAEEEQSVNPLQSAFPRGRIKNIMKLDKDVNKVNAEGLLLVSRSAELFIQFLAEKSAEVAIEKKRKTVKPEHIRMAAKRHQPTSDFLLDSLPLPQASDRPSADKLHPRPAAHKLIPAGARRIDHFFNKAAEGTPQDADGLAAIKARIVRGKC